MGHVGGFILGVIGAVGACVVLGISEDGGAARDVTMFVGIVLGFVIGYPMGYMIGTIPFFDPAKSSTNDESKLPQAFAPQTVGRDCHVCHEKIIFVADGIRCEKCDTVFHPTCAEECPTCDVRS